MHLSLRYRETDCPSDVYNGRSSANRSKDFRRATNLTAASAIERRHQAVGKYCRLVAGMLQHDYSLIGRSLEDVIIEPVRSILIPGFDLVKKRCKDAGALGGGISGSGPSIFMLSKEESIARQIEYIMTEVYVELGIEFKTYVTTVNYEGVQVVS